MQPFFSIIVPVYNVAPYLRACLDSVLAQTFGDWECLCVDDGSTDGSGEILDVYARGDSRFRVFHQTNKGVSAARNFALDRMRGEWFWCVDGDDAIRSDALAWLHDVVACYSQLDSIAFYPSIGKQFSEVKWLPLPLVNEVCPTEQVTSFSLSAHRQAAWSTVMRRSPHRFEPYVIGEDALFQVTAYFMNRQRLALSERFYFYRERPQSAVRTPASFVKVRDLLTTEKRILQCLVDHQARWQANGLEQFLKWKRDFVWFTFQKLFYRLPLREMKALIPLWCDVQQMLFMLRKVSVLRYGIWRLIHLAQSPLVCKLLIYWPKVIQERLCRYVRIQYIKLKQPTINH